MKFLDRLLGKQLEPVVLSGGKPLEVVGESFYTENFDKIVSRVPSGGFLAVLEAEPLNPHDPNAVAVKVGGLTVGYLDRKTAAGYQSAVIRLTSEHGRPIALRAEIGRGHGADGFYSVTLDHDPNDFV